MIEWVLLILLVIVLIYLFWKYSELRGEIETRARGIFEKWRTTELETQANEKAQLLFQNWMREEERRIREDAIKKSEAVIKGKVTEHLIPFFPDFSYNPKDARFIGSPVDLVIFDGLNEGELKKVVFVEVKTGKTAGLSERERLVKQCVENKNVVYEMIHRKSEKEE
ncbi:MAG: Holliday junction resolvase [Methanophagales archaeon ANME-1-THS]|nr:MAG: Holliday junction resolvase [Methanophagales archaeon ANME-1-THS]